MKKLLTAFVALALTACFAQEVKLKPPPPVVPSTVLKQDIKVFQVTDFTQPSTPVMLPHTPAFGTIVVMTLKGTTILDQSAVIYELGPLTLTLDPNAQIVGATVEVRYFYLPDANQTSGAQAK